MIWLQLISAFVIPTIMAKAACIVIDKIPINESKVIEVHEEYRYPMYVKVISTVTFFSFTAFLYFRSEMASEALDMYSCFIFSWFGYGFGGWIWMMSFGALYMIPVVQSMITLDTN